MGNVERYEARHGDDATRQSSLDVGQFGRQIFSVVCDRVCCSLTSLQVWRERLFLNKDHDSFEMRGALPRRREKRSAVVSLPVRDIFAEFRNSS